jgi:hypothetical protein
MVAIGPADTIYYNDHRNRYIRLYTEYTKDFYRPVERNSNHVDFVCFVKFILNSCFEQVQLINDDIPGSDNGRQSSYVFNILFQKILRATEMNGSHIFFHTPYLKILL